MNESDVAETKVELGEFPFPLSDGPEESRFLSWLRNHSNYMTARGFLDYLRFVGVLVRGIVVNFLIFLPYLLFVSLIVGYLHHWTLEHPYRVTLIVLIVAGSWILLFPVVIQLFKIFTHKKSLETGNESSMFLRDVYERSFGGLLLAVLAAALFDTAPWILELRNELFQDKHVGWKGTIASVAGVLAVLSGSDKLFSLFRGTQKKIAMVLIGLLGLLVPAWVILYATDFLVYGLPPTPNMMYSPLVIPIVGVLGIVTAILMGIFRRAFSLKEGVAVAGFLAAGVVLVLSVILGINSALIEGKIGNDQLQGIIDPLERVAAQFHKISNQDEMTPEVAALVDEVVIAERQYKRRDKEIRRQIALYGDADAKSKTRRSDGQNAESLNNDEGKPQGFVAGWSDFFAKWGRTEQLAKWRGEYFTLGQRFITLGDQLSAQPRGSLEPLRREVAKLAHESLLEELEQKMRINAFQSVENKLAFFIEQTVKNDPSALMLLSNVPLPKSQPGGPMPDEVAQSESQVRAFQLEAKIQADVAKLLRGKLIEWYLIQQVEAETQRTERFHPEHDAAGSVLDEVDQVRVRLGKFRDPETIVTDGMRQALVDLQDWTAAELSILVPEEKLYLSVNKEFNEEEAKHARLAGKEALAILLPKDRLIEMALLSTEREHGQLTALVLERLIQKALPTWRADPWMTEPTVEQMSVAADRLAVLAKVVAPMIPEGDMPLAEEPRPAASQATEAAIAEAAALELSRFDVKRLAMIAGGDHRLYPPGATEKEIDQFEQALTGAEYLPRNELIERILKTVKAEFESTARVSSKFPDVYKIHLARQALVNRDAAQMIDATMAREPSVPRMQTFARRQLLETALTVDLSTPSEESDSARDELRKLYEGDEDYYLFAPDEEHVHPFSNGELASIAMAKFPYSTSDAPNKLTATLMFGKYGVLERGEPGTIKMQGRLASIKKELTESVFRPKAIFVFLIAAVIWLACWFTVDINVTSIHGLYRDRLASAFLVGDNTSGDVDIEEDIDLEDICCYEARSTAPYHLINVALNLQGSKDISIRDRNSDFFVFSKRFIGGHRTGYCRSGTMEQIFPQMSLATAMAISAAAASPNMGRSTSPLLVAFMALLNIRLGFWVPNPGQLEEYQNTAQRKEKLRAQRQSSGGESPQVGFAFREVFAEELEEIERRWEQVDPHGAERHRRPTLKPTVDHGLVGIGFSGGGIRSATLNLGIAQVLHKRGIFKHLDYMSTVSGGGYLGSSISTLMRSRTTLQSEVAGTVTVEKEKLISEIAGTVSIPSSTSDQIVVVVTPNSESEYQEKKIYRFAADAKLAVSENQEISEGQMLIVHRGVHRRIFGTGTGVREQPSVDSHDQVVIVTPSDPSQRRTYRFAKDAHLNVRDRENVSAGKPLMKPRATKSQSEIAGTVSVDRTSTGDYVVRVQGVHGDERRSYYFSRFERLVVRTGSAVKAGQELILRHNTLGERFSWRVRPSAFLAEMRSKLDESHLWVNLSDGGHLENLATVELLRRRCKYIFIGDGEADPRLHFKGLATLIRFSRIDLGIDIDIDLTKLELNDDNCSTAHWAIGRITYPKATKDSEVEIGYLLYFKSTFTGDEDAVMQEYRHRNPAFPHESTADQFFDEGQFEAYRALGQHIAENALEGFNQPTMSYSDLGNWLTTLWENEQPKKKRRKKTGDAETKGG